MYIVYTRMDVIALVEATIAIVRAAVRAKAAVVVVRVEVTEVTEKKISGARIRG